MYQRNAMYTLNLQVTVKFVQLKKKRERDTRLAHGLAGGDDRK